MSGRANSSPRTAAASAQPSLVSVGVGILVACCLSAMLLSGLF